MFHEMLHLRYPVNHQGARRCVHTKEFKKAEKEFANYAGAKAALRTFVEGAACHAPGTRKLAASPKVETGLEPAIEVPGSSLPSR